MEQNSQDIQIQNVLAEKLAHLPALPGVYLMKEQTGSVLYVGKAKNLKNRVRSYFQRSQDQRYKVKLLVSRITDFETIITQTEKEALILENTLIKKYRPRFNVTFRDDKNYPYLRLSLDEPYPTLTIARQAKKDRSQYFGPFASTQAVRETLKLINLIFPLRKCHGKRLEKKRPCIYHQLGQCPAPCCCMVDADEYQKTVREVQLFLQGRGREIIASLRKKMELDSQALRFEQAARTRDRIHALEETLEKQTMVSLDFTDRDVFSFYREEDRMEMVVLFVRSGRLGGSRSFTLRNLQLADEEVLCSFLTQYYDHGKFIPQEIITPLPLQDKGLLQEWLHETSGHKVSMVSVTHGPRYELLKMAAQNAEILFHRQTAREQQARADILASLQEKLRLKNYPGCIECFDISNISGTSAVGAAVRFEQGEPQKNGYRRFRVKTVQQVDDYAMMYEVLSRHLARVRTGGRIPDLIMVDGGKGQLGILLRALQDADMSTIDAISLAKGRASRSSREGNFAGDEKIFLAHRKGPLLLPQRSPVMLLLQRIRDEAHRFAITYHQKLKATHDLNSPLEGIKGIGKSTARRMLQHFGTMEQIRSASRQQLETLPFLNKKTAVLIYDYFHTKTAGEPKGGNL